MIRLKRIFLFSGFFVLTAILGFIYFFVGHKYGVVSIKIGENSFDAEVAESMAQKARGLSYRDSLDKKGAMYFDFGKEDKYGFWMMGMKFPIDIVWIKNNIVVGIEKNVPAPVAGTPESALKIYYPPEAIDKVVEISAGLSDELGIKIGDNFVILR